MTAIFYRDCRALSPNGRFTLTARSPHNGKIPHRDGRPASDEEFAFKYRQHQFEFRYQLSDVSGRVLWERWQSKGEDSPGELFVSDDGWSIISTHGFRPQVIALSPAGEHVMRVSVAGPDITPRTGNGRPGDAGVRWVATRLAWTTAGIIWTFNSVAYFLSHDRAQYFVWRTSWGQRLVLNLSAATLIDDAAQAAPRLADAITAAEIQTTRDLLVELTPRTDGAEAPPRSRLGDDGAEDEEPDLSSTRRFLLWPALHLVGVHRMIDCVPILRRWEAVDRVSYSTGTTAFPDGWICAQSLRPIVQQSLRRLDREPAGYAAYHFESPRGERLPAPERLHDRRQRTASLKTSMPAVEVLGLLGAPDHVHRESHRNEKNLYDWTEDWEYDFRDPESGRWTTLRITWEEENRRRSRIRKVEESPSYWLESDRRDLEILRH